MNLPSATPIPERLRSEGIGLINLQEGIVSGGGVALLNASQKISPKGVGEEILLEAITAPFKIILENAGLEQTGPRPEKGIGVDVITGFPTETEDDFFQTYNLLDRLKVSYLHVFTYSERENTLGASMESKVPQKIITIVSC